MILVTGGAGYIGSVLVPELLARGHAVRVYDKLLFGVEGLARVRDRIDLVQGDIRSFDPAVLDGVTAVINLAALSNDPMAEFQPRANHEMNTLGTERVARAAKKHGVRRFVQASSCSVYDRGPDAGDLLQDEQAEVAPTATYAVSKHEAERVLLALADEAFCPVILRKGTVFGFSPRMRYDLVINTFVRDALVHRRLTVYHGGQMWRPLVDVRDCAQAYILAVEAESERVHGEIFNVVRRNYQIRELALAVQAALAGTCPVEVTVDDTPGPTRSYRVSGDKLTANLGFEARVSIAASVTDMLEQIPLHGATDFLHPRYSNIAWFKALLEMQETIARCGPIL